MSEPDKLEVIDLLAKTIGHLLSAEAQAVVGESQPEAASAAVTGEPLPIRLLGISVASLGSKSGNGSKAILESAVSVAGSTVEAVGRARNESSHGDGHGLAVSIRNAVSLYRVLQKLSVAWVPAASSDHTAALASAKDAVLASVTQDLDRLQIAEAISVSRLVLRDFDALCTVHGRAIAAFGARKAAAVVSRYAVPVKQDAIMEAGEFLASTALHPADAASSSAALQLLGAAMDRRTFEAAVDLIAAIGRTVESRGETCGRSVRLAVPRARLSRGAV